MHFISNSSTKDDLQMLFGVAPKLRQSIVERGHKMRVYVPYGKQWFTYSTRRLKENPNMVWHIIKALFVKIIQLFSPIHIISCCFTFYRLIIKRFMLFSPSSSFSILIR